MKTISAVIFGLIFGLLVFTIALAARSPSIEVECNWRAGVEIITVNKIARGDTNEKIMKSLKEYFVKEKIDAYDRAAMLEHVKIVLDSRKDLEVLLKQARANWGPEEGRRWVAKMWGSSAFQACISKLKIDEKRT